MALRESVPREFTDDVLWYKFFTKKMLTVFITITFLGFLLCRLLSVVHLEAIGILSTVLADLVAMIIIRAPIPSANLLSGSKLTIADYLIRMHLSKKRERDLYIKGYREEQNSCKH